MQFEDGHTPPPGLPELPTGWRYAYFTYAVNFEGTAPLRVRITYRQPHLPGDIAPYLPILPNPDPAGRYEVRFEAAPGLRLEPVGNRPGQIQTRHGQTRWTASPKHLQMLHVRVVESSERASGRNAAP